MSQVTPLSFQSSFPSLQEISLANNQISSWKSVEVLDLFPKIQRARITANPITCSLPAATARNLAICCAGKICVLNGSPVTAADRINAERLADKLFAGSPPARLSRHTATEEPAIHNSTSQEQVAAAVPTGEFVNITIECNTPSATSAGVHPKRVPLSMKVETVKQLAFKLFGLDTRRQVLMYREGGSKEGACPIQLDDDSRELWFFSVRNGGVVAVEEKIA